MVRYAWLTYASDSQYLEGSLVLYQSILNVGTRHDFVLMIPHNFETDIILPNSIIVKRIDPIAKPCEKRAKENYTNVYSKLYAWTLEEYDKVCWIDSDMIIVQNIDDIFNIDISCDWIAAARGCTCNFFKNPKHVTQPESCPFNTKQIDPYLNTGLFIVRPNKNMFNMLLNVDYNHPFCEQDAFNIVFKNKKIVLSSSFNFLNHITLPHNDMMDDIRVFHFGYGKPWHENILDMHHDYYDLWKSYRNNITRRSLS